MLQADPTLMLH